MHLRLIRCAVKRISTYRIRHLTIDMHLNIKLVPLKNGIHGCMENVTVQCLVPYIQGL